MQNVCVYIVMCFCLFFRTIAFLVTHFNLNDGFHKMKWQAKITLHSVCFIWTVKVKSERNSHLSTCSVLLLPLLLNEFDTFSALWFLLPVLSAVSLERRIYGTLSILHNNRALSVRDFVFYSSKCAGLLFHHTEGFLPLFKSSLALPWG